MQMPGDYILSVIYIGQKQIADTFNKSFDNREEAQQLHHSFWIMGCLGRQYKDKLGDFGQIVSHPPTSARVFNFRQISCKYFLVNIL